MRVKWARRWFCLDIMAYSERERIIPQCDSFGLSSHSIVCSPAFLSLCFVAWLYLYLLVRSTFPNGESRSELMVVPIPLMMPRKITHPYHRPVRNSWLLAPKGAVCFFMSRNEMHHQLRLHSFLICTLAFITSHLSLWLLHSSRSPQRLIWCLWACRL